MSKLTFDPKRHRYELDGEWQPGVTTIIGTVLAKPQLIQWAANEAVDFIEAKGYLRSLSDEDNEFVVDPDILTQARTAHISRRDKAADKGTGVHSLAEDYVRMCMLENEGHPLPKDSNEAPIAPFITWARDNNSRFLDCEVMVYSATHKYAGRFDLLFEQDGKRYLGDIKTGKGVYPDYFIQLGAYQIAHTELGGQVDGCTILHLNSKSLHAYTSDNSDRDRKAFLNCLELYRLLKEFPDYNKWTK